MLPSSYYCQTNYCTGYPRELMLCHKHSGLLWIYATEAPMDTEQLPKCQLAFDPIDSETFQTFWQGMPSKIPSWLATLMHSQANTSTCYQYPVPYLSAIEQRPVLFPWVPASISANSLLQITTTAPKSTSEVLHWPAFIPASLAWFEFYMTTILPGQTTWFLSQCLPNLVPWPKMPRLGTTILWLNCILMVLLHWPP